MSSPPSILELYALIDMGQALLGGWKNPGTPIIYETDGDARGLA